MLDSAIEAPGSPVAAAAGLLLVVAGLALAPFAALLGRRLWPGRRVFFARWGFSHVGLVVLGTIAGGGLAAGAAVGLKDSLLAGVPEVVVDLGATAAAFTFASALVFLIARRLDPEGWRSVGLAPGGTLRAVGLGLASYVLAVPAIVGTMLLWPWVVVTVEGAYVEQDVVRRLAELDGAWVGMAMVFAVLVVPLLEEILFRGFLQPLLVQNLGDKSGVIGTSFVFGALHGVNAFLPIFALSLVIGFVYLKSQRLGAAWLVHALHNGGMMLLLFAAPELASDLGAEGSPGEAP